MLTTAPHPQFQQYYYQPRVAGELDLIQEVRTLLCGIGRQAQVATCYDTHPYIRAAVDKIPFIQRYYLVQYWTLQLMLLDHDTVLLRDTLNSVRNPGDEKLWLRIFEEKILPTIVNGELPVSLDDLSVVG